jgi:outer membrane protein
MKKLILMLALALPMLATAEKIGHINTQEVMALMPETKKMAHDLDSIQNVYENQLANMQEEFNKKLAEFQQQQSTMTANVREFRQQELAEMEQRMQVFYQTIQKELQAKQVELLQPVQNKLLEAINKVAAAQTCTYVVDRASVLYVGADATDLTPAVRAELGIK